MNNQDQGKVNLERSSLVVSRNRLCSNEWQQQQPRGTNVDDKILTLKQLGERWHLSDPTIRRMIRHGKLTVIRMGGAEGRGTIRVSLREVERAEQAWSERRGDEE